MGKGTSAGRLPDSPTGSRCQLDRRGPRSTDPFVATPVTEFMERLILAGWRLRTRKGASPSRESMLKEEGEEGMG